jgi:hypothetical protein
MSAPLAEAHRLLCAANLAYGVTDATAGTGELQPAGPILPSRATVDSLLAAAGLGAGYRHGHQADGRDGIDAFLYEETADAAILAFRGTLPVRFALQPAVGAGRIFGDWLNNTRLALVSGAPHGLPGCVHEGYARSLDNLWTSPEGLSRLLGRIAAATAEGRRLLVTGHSKGGALALLAALRLAATGDPALLPAAVHTFGAPRAGNAAFAQAFERTFRGRAWRFEYQNDVVPHLPPAEGAWFAAREACHQFRSHAPEGGWSWKSVGALADAFVRVGAYESAGCLQFIDWSGQLRTDDTPLLRRERLDRLRQVLARAPAAINRDHLPMRGYGYMDFLAARQA